MKEGYVSGYMVQSIKDGVSIEQLFFFDGGKIFEGVEQKFGKNFKSSNWVKSSKSLDWLHDKAEFIGTYPRPSNVQWTEEDVIEEQEALAWMRQNREREQYIPIPHPGDYVE